MRTTAIIAAALATVAIPGVAAADRGAYRVPLGEVTLDPRETKDVIYVGARTPFSELELRARRDHVPIRGLTIRFEDGHLARHTIQRVLAPGERVLISLPHAGFIKAVIVDYGRRDHGWDGRPPARLAIFGVNPIGHRDPYGRHDRR